MSTFQFDRSSHTIQLTGSGGGTTGPFTAYNNVDSHSKGPWPDGTFTYNDYNSHSELSDPDGEYGAHGILIFNVPGRTGMGVHSGRAGIPDGLGREGPQHCTLGCIRTTDEAMAAFLQVIANDAMQSIEVDTSGAESAAAVRVGVPAGKARVRRAAGRKQAKKSTSPRKKGVPPRKKSEPAKASARGASRKQR